MAEAHSIASLDLYRVPHDHLHVLDLHREKERGIHITPTPEGIVLFFPSPLNFATYLYRRIKRWKNNLVTLLWPAPPVAALTAYVGFTSIVLSQPGSWFRQGLVANVLWNLDEKYNPLRSLIPRTGRIFYLALFAGGVGILGAMALQRLYLRVLLSYRGWLSESRPGLLTKLWGLSLKIIYLPHEVLGGRHPLTYSFQSALPLQPIPSLQNTINRYLASIKPLVSQEEFEKTSKDAKVFANTVGKKLQRFLIAKRLLWAKNYVSDWWLQYVYLYARSSLIINSNYYGLGWGWKIPSQDQLSRAAVLLYHYTRFKTLLDNEQLEPIMIRGTVPICMDQYRRMFGTSRIPGAECDTLEQNEVCNYVVVCCRGIYFRLDFVNPTTHKRLLPAELLVRLRYIQACAEKGYDTTLGCKNQQRDQILEEERQVKEGGARNSVKAALATAQTYDSGRASAAASNSISALTTLPRAKWAEGREHFLLRGVNGASLAEIEGAAFVLCLDSTPIIPGPEGWTKAGKLLLCSNGGVDRWADKTVTLVVFGNGFAGIHAEHSWADAPVLAHMWEWVMHEEICNPMYDNSGIVIGAPPVSEATSLSVPSNPVPFRLQWHLSRAAEELILEAKQQCIEAGNDLDLNVFEFGAGEGEFGPGRMKACKMSPDSFIQMCLQLAYFRDAGKFCLTYESAMTRLFREGRTETIRSLSEESCKFVNLMMDPSATKEERKKALLVAGAKHSEKSKLAMIGEGTDRHLFALYVTARGMKYPEDSFAFLKKSLSTPWTLSSSQLPQRQSPPGFWKVPPTREICSPSGGFGPVVDDGYGVSYMVATEEVIYMHISSKKSCPATDSVRFSETIKQSFKDMEALFK